MSVGTERLAIRGFLHPGMVSAVNDKRLPTFCISKKADFRMSKRCRIESLLQARRESSMKKPYSRPLILGLAGLAALILCGSLVLSAADHSTSLPPPPIGKRKLQGKDINGVKLVDNYEWLRKKKNP